MTEETGERKDSRHTGKIEIPKRKVNWNIVIVLILNIYLLLFQFKCFAK